LGMDAAVELVFIQFKQVNIIIPVFPDRSARWTMQAAPCAHPFGTHSSQPSIPVLDRLL